MYGSVNRDLSVALQKTPRFGITSASFAVCAFLVELLAVVAAAELTGCLYHLAVYGAYGYDGSFADVGALAGLVYGLSFLIRGEYGVDYILEGRRTNARLWLSWNMAFVSLAVIGFLTKSTAMFSRGWILLFYIVGLLSVIAINAGLERALAGLMARGFMCRRKMLIIGTAEDVARLARDILDGAGGVQVAQTVVVPVDALHAADLDQILEGAVRKARVSGIEDVVISNGLSNQDVLERAVSAFSLLPVAIHLGAGGLVSRFKDARIARFGRATALSLTREPLGQLEALSKRAFDVVCAGLAIVLLTPLFLVVAALIKLDSKGPVFFRQRRRGFNLEEFGIWKFRTMTTLDDGDTIKQAAKNDMRVTAVGRLLRKYSIDELPQLFNVLKGEMSLVGPRPHAVAHDRFYEQRIALYPRRLNMKPGITGWAQVNGFRGATGTDEAMRQRVEHDLFYIDNWSVAFDCYIIALTIFSSKTRRNAY